MLDKILIDRTPFDKFIIKVPEDVYDAFSYVRGVEDVLTLIRQAKRENEDESEDLSE